MSRRSWGILVLVCVVALVAIAGVAYQSNADKSVEDAVRYYADAIAEGRVEDALKVEAGDSFGEATKNADHAVDLRSAVASEHVWVKEIRGTISPICMDVRERSSSSRSVRTPLTVKSTWIASRNL